MGLNITSVGMVSSLGLDWSTSCAAARCGISRACGLSHYRLQAGDPVDVRLVQAHEVALLTNGFEGEGRLLRLLAGAFRDLRNHAAIDTEGEELPIYLAAPSSRRIKSNINLMLDEDDRCTQSGVDDDGELEDLDLSRDLLNHAARLAQWTVPPRLRAESRDGAAGLVELIRLCSDEMESRKVVRALIGAVDSLLDEETLVWLHKTGRLKHPAAPTGLMPGEAAVLFLVERNNSGRHMGSFSATATEHEAQSLASGTASHGSALASAIIGVGKQVAWPADTHPWIVSDFNGETYRAHEWGCAMHRLLRANPIFGEVTSSFPANSFGDTGCAAPAVAAASVVAAWTRGYAPDSRCCVTASSDGGTRAAAILTAAESIL